MLLVGPADRQRVRIPSGADPKALIEEARQRARRRRWRGWALFVLLAAAAVLGWRASGSGGAGVVTETATRPFVNVRAFGGEGELAFISRGTLWALNGGSGSLRKVATTHEATHAEGNPDFGGITAGTPLGPATPVFSHDGRWLAYVVPHAAGNGSFAQLWIARGDGTDPRLVRGLAVDQLIGWSPTADMLAVTTDTRTAPFWDPATRTRIRTTERTTVLLVSPGGARRRIVSSPATRHGPWIYDAAWSPDGRAIAVATYEGFPSPLSTIRAYPLAGGAPTTWLVLRARTGLAGVCTAACGGVTPDLAGWWPGWGIAFWALPGALAQTVDATALEVLTAPYAAPRLIANTIANGTTTEVVAGAHGALALVETTGQTGRQYTRGKAVETCAPATRTCAALPNDTTWSGSEPRFPCPSPCNQYHRPPAGKPDSAVSLDPAWSPTGEQLAYVQAPTTPTAENPPASWFAAHKLFVWNASTGTSRQLAGAAGAIVPGWSGDGRHVLYVSNDGLWLMPLATGTPIEIEHPLFPANALASLSFYGQIPWSAHFSWWTPVTPAPPFAWSAPPGAVRARALQ